MVAKVEVQLLSDQSRIPSVQSTITRRTCSYLVAGELKDPDDRLHVPGVGRRESLRTLQNERKKELEKIIGQHIFHRRPTRCETRLRTVKISDNIKDTATLYLGDLSDEVSAEVVVGGGGQEGQQLLYDELHVHRVRHAEQKVQL